MTLIVTTVDNHTRLANVWKVSDHYELTRTERELCNLKFRYHLHRIMSDTYTSTTI